MKLDKAAAIRAQLQPGPLGMSVLDAGNTLLARFNKGKEHPGGSIFRSSQLRPASSLNLHLRRRPGRRCGGA
ncbi:hypothetical protein ACHWUR_00470 [Klebsiella pneumoniae]